MTQWPLTLTFALVLLLDVADKILYKRSHCSLHGDVLTKIDGEGRVCMKCKRMEERP